MNKAILIGRVVKDPELRTTPNNRSVCQFAIAVNRTYTNEEGKREADFINCVVWDKQAENLTKYQKKGNQIAVEGRIQTRNYDDKDGKKVYVTEVIAEETYFADSRREGDAMGGGNPFAGVDAPFSATESQSDFTPVTDDDLPFL